jgi:hypothetical protein
MKNKEIVISLFEEGVGKLKHEKAQEFYGDKKIHILSFLNEETSIEILLFFHQDQPNASWTVHHELSKENANILKQICSICTEIQKRTADSVERFEMSEELSIIYKQSFFDTSVKSRIQNLITKHFVLFKGNGRR